jgi:UDP-glucose 4-epimerase
MKWLITGGCGFIGRVLVSELLWAVSQRVCVLDNLRVGTKTNLRTVSPFLSCL